MFGFAFAALCGAGLIFLGARRRRRYGGYGMYRLFRRLQTTPGQERAIRNILNDFKDSSRNTWKQVRNTRPELGEIFSGERFDEERVRSFVEGRKAELRPLEEQFLTSLRQIHEVLDNEQRRLVSWWLSREPHVFHHHHHCHHSC